MWEAEIWRIMVPDQLVQKRFVRSPYQRKKPGNVGICLSSQWLQEAQIGISYLAKIETISPKLPMKAELEVSLKW
jgi:hypothetical protein